MPASNFQKSNKTFILSKNNLEIPRGQTFGCEGSGCRVLRSDFPGHAKRLARFRETIFSVVSKHLWVSKLDDEIRGILSRATRGIHSGVLTQLTSRMLVRPCKKPRLLPGGSTMNNTNSWAAASNINLHRSVKKDMWRQELQRGFSDCKHPTESRGVVGNMP